MATGSNIAAATWLLLACLQLGCHTQPIEHDSTFVQASASSRLPAPTRGRLAEGVWLVRVWHRLQDGTLYSVNSLELASSADVEVFDAAPRHMPQERVIYLPAQRILYGGRTVRALDEGLGPYGQDELVPWRESVLELQQRYPHARQVIPGRGKPGGRALLSHTLTMLHLELSELGGRFGGG